MRRSTSAGNWVSPRSPSGMVWTRDSAGARPSIRIFWIITGAIARNRNDAQSHGNGNQAGGGGRADRTEAFAVGRVQVGAAARLRKQCGVRYSQAHAAAGEHAAAAAARRPTEHG